MKKLYKGAEVYAPQTLNDAEQILKNTGIDLTDESNQLLKKVIIAKDKENLEIYKEACSAKKVSARDSIVYNPASNGVPIFGQDVIAFNLQAITELLAARSSEKIMTDYQQGSFITTYLMMKVKAFSGNTGPYSSDSADNKVGVNYTYPHFDIERVDTHVEYTTLQQASAASMKEDIVSANYEAAAQTIAQHANAIYFFGVEGKKIFGLINNPQNPTAISPISEGGKTKMADVTPVTQTKNFNLLYSDIASRLGGNLTPNASMTWIVSPTVDSALNDPVDITLITTRQTIQRSYPNLKIVSAVEYEAEYNGGVGLMQLIVDKVGANEQNTLLASFSYKFKAHGAIKTLDGMKEKISAGLGGCIVTIPAAVATMVGVS